MTRVVLAAAYRTPIGVLGGAFKDVPAYDLGATLIEHIIKETGLNPSEINEVIIGNVLTSRTRTKSSTNCCYERWLARNSTCIYSE